MPMPFPFAPTERRRPTVVLLHSSASSRRQWQELIELLEPRFELHAIDLHGHGSRPDWRGAAPMTLADDAALVEPLLAQAGAVHVVGHSYGAAVGVELARLHPDKVLSLAGYEPVLFRALLDDPASAAAAGRLVATFDFMRDRLGVGDASAAARRFIDFWSGDGAWDALPEGRRQALAPRMASVLMQGDALFRKTYDELGLARLHLPMLLLSGSGTVEAARRIGGLLRAALPLAAHEALPRMGHMGPITHAPTVNARIARFLEAAACGRDPRAGFSAAGRATRSPAPSSAGPATLRA